MPLIQVDRSRCDAWLIDCKWPLRDINNKPAWTNCRALWPNYSCHEIIYLQHCLELVMLVYTRITHFRQCCNYNLLPAMYGRVLSLLSVRFFGYIYLGDGDTDRREILHDGMCPGSSMCLLRFWGRCPHGIPKSKIPYGGYCVFLTHLLFFSVTHCCHLLHWPCRFRLYFLVNFSIWFRAAD